MKALKVSTLLLGAVLFLGLGSTTLSAEMKCGAGKCGKAMMAPKTCDDVKCAEGQECKCGPDCKCEHKGKKDKASKCGSSKCGAQQKAKKVDKCGGEKKAPKKSMKCGTGKCG